MWNYVLFTFFTVDCFQWLLWFLNCLVSCWRIPATQCQASSNQQGEHTEFCPGGGTVTLMKTRNAVWISFLRVGYLASSGVGASLKNNHSLVGSWTASDNLDPTRWFKKRTFSQDLCLTFHSFHAKSLRSLETQPENVHKIRETNVATGESQHCQSVSLHLLTANREQQRLFIPWHAHFIFYVI